MPLLQKFYAGYKQGAEAIDPSIKVQVKYLTEPPDFGGFNDAAKGQTAAQGMIDNGADVLFTAAGGSNAGAFKTAKPGKDWLIGTDSDQYKIPALNAIKDIIITSMLKHVDVAVYSMIKSCIDGLASRASMSMTWHPAASGTPSPTRRSSPTRLRLTRLRRRSSLARSWCPTRPDGLGRVTHGPGSRAVACEPGPSPSAAGLA